MAADGFETPRVRVLAIGTGLALEQLCGADPKEAADFCEAAAQIFDMTNLELAAAVMFSQTAVTKGEPLLHFTAGISMAIKFFRDIQFKLSDLSSLIDFSIEDLMAAEARLYQAEEGRLATATSRLRIFRNALTRLVLDLEEIPAAVGGTAVPDLHVLVVDDSPIVRMAHSNLVLGQQPHATVKGFDNAKDAVAYASAADARGKPVNLVLLDLDLQDDSERSGSATFFSCLSTADPFRSGLGVAENVDPNSESCDPSLSMGSYKPLVAMVSRCVTTQSSKTSLLHRGCDLALPKPLRPDQLRVLIDACPVA